MSELPPRSLVRQYDTHRLIPSQYSLPQGASVLTLLLLLLRSWQH